MEKSNRVVCICDLSKSADQWGRPVYMLTSIFPKKDEICKVLEVRDGTFCKKCYRLENYPYLWDADMFRPVDECGPAICEKIEKELEQVAVPMIALFCLRLGIPTEKLLP